LLDEAFSQKAVTVRPDLVPDAGNQDYGYGRTFVNGGVFPDQPFLQLDRAVSGAIWQLRNREFVCERHRKPMSLSL